MMRRISILPLLILLTLATSAQDNAAKPMAPFEITTITNQEFKSFQVKRNEPVIIMYFSPECDHCRDLTKEIVKNIKLISTKPLYMITYFPIAEVKKFANDLSLQKYPSIKVGTEGMKLIVQKHYNIRNFPFVVLYNKSGKMVKMFREQAPAADIIKAMQQL
ncbi:MAG: hypothetical protein EOO04_31760 [Chitinophagaceae bacterium]|nr:MAG: hypothetical protein EOO04_31760 [Chitinophagaceae bacterium]